MKQTTKQKKKIIKQKIKNQDENWFTTEAITKLGLIFLAIQLIGLIIAQNIYTQGYTQALFTENINDAINGIYLFGMIIITTIIFLLIVKFKRTKKLLWGVEMLAIFSTSLIVFSSFFPTSYLTALILTTVIFILRYSQVKNITTRSLAAGIAIMGAGAYIGTSIGMIPLVIFVTILSLYDIIAVFFTKHMIQIGKESTQNNYAFTIAIPTKKHHFEIGNGDLVIPLALASSIITSGPFTNNWIISGLIILMSYLGITISLQFVSKYKTPMPALPPQVMLMLITILLGLILGA
ncbi:MAG: presenilin family intramembrane aspartyl protease [Candidatus ainarchaeum sp.]|jgi:presenilin-like A22 family membrane protease|nr:presenilin family intramembrane aspartyl protease [Candidatus ainarchaeum sp.]MDD4467851.1 presenilin family intramembrane aspartyl protease [Candidatus ainarchaeum sp.]